MDVRIYEAWKRQSAAAFKNFRVGSGACDGATNFQYSAIANGNVHGPQFAVDRNTNVTNYEIVSHRFN